MANINRVENTDSFGTWLDVTNDIVDEVNLNAPIVEDIGNRTTALENSTNTNSLNIVELSSEVDGIAASNADNISATGIDKGSIA